MSDPEYTVYRRAGRGHKKFLQTTSRAKAGRNVKTILEDLRESCVVTSARDDTNVIAIRFLEGLKDGETVQDRGDGSLPRS